MRRQPCDEQLPLVGEEDSLYRAARAKSWVDKDRGRLTAAAFKLRERNPPPEEGQEKGLSVGIASAQSPQEFLERVQIQHHGVGQVPVTCVSEIAAWSDTLLCVKQDADIHAEICGLFGLTSDLQTAIAVKLSECSEIPIEAN